MTAQTLLPHVTAALNSLALLLLLAGFVLVRSGQRDRHKAVMVAAVVTSALFLAAYLVYHFTAPIFVFPGPASVKPFYYAILISHVVLATVILPFIVTLLRRALSGRIEAHRKIAKLTFAMWVYVSASGVAVYALLYHVFPPAS